MSERTENNDIHTAAKHEYCQGVLTVISADEFYKIKEQFPHYKELLHGMSSIRYCKAEVFKECVTGTLRIPQKSIQHTPQMSFRIYMTEQSLIFIENTGNLNQWVSKQADLLRDLSAPDQIFLQLLERIIEDDLFYLLHLEQELENMEDELSHSVSNDFFLTLTKYRQKLSEFNAYYEELIDIGEQMQSKICRSLIQSTEEWNNYTRRAERLQNHVSFLRENVLQLRELYQAQQDAKQNRIMELLTVITTLFLPLSLLTGWYGMNFSNMPELQWKYGYITVIIISIVIVICEIIYFKKKKFF